MIVVKSTAEIQSIYKSFGVKNYTRLQRKHIVDKNGHSRIVYVKPDEVETNGILLRRKEPKELRKIILNKMLDENKPQSYEEFEKMIDKMNIRKNKNTQVMLEQTNNFNFINEIYTLMCERKTELIKIKVNKNVDKDLKTISGHKKGKTMTFAEANFSHTNPYYYVLPGYEMNCATCVPVFEARLRGYNVKARPYSDGNDVAWLAKFPTLIWEGESIFSWEKYNGENTDLCNYLSEKIKANERYEVKHDFAENQYHVVVIGKDKDNNIYLYDPQSAELYYKEFDVKTYLNQHTTWEYFRIDNVNFNKKFVDKVME